MLKELSKESKIAAVTSFNILDIHLNDIPFIHKNIETKSQLILVDVEHKDYRLLSDNEWHMYDLVEWLQSLIM